MSCYTILNYHPGILGDEERQTLESRLTALERAYNALDLFTDTAGTTSPLQRQSHEWTLIAQMIKIRNRLVHPKHGNDVLVTDDELQVIESASKTIVYLFSESLLRSGNAIQNKAEQVVKHFKDYKLKRAVQN